MLPLEGIRVLDLTQVFSGPFATRILGDLGADVIKLEATRRPDPERGPIRPSNRSDGYPDGNPGPDPYNRAGRFLEYNRNKYGLTLDLSTDEGHAIFLGLTKISDVVIENFSAGVMDRLGLGHDALRAVKPDIITVSMPAFGTTGPEANYVAFGPHQECLSGLALICGYERDKPLVTPVYSPDPTVGLVAASAVLISLWERDCEGDGQHIEIAQREAICFATPEPVFDYAVTGKRLSPQNNRHEQFAPQGCYRCLGEDEWVSITVTSDEQWRALCMELGEPEMAYGPRFETASLRRQHHDEIDARIRTWTRKHEKYWVMTRLQSVGIPAGAVLTVRDLLADPHFRERGFFLPVNYTGIGIHPSLGFPWKFSATAASVRLPPPCLGEHSAYLLQQLLGLSPDEILVLEGKGIVGTIPIGTTDRE